MSDQRRLRRRITTLQAMQDQRVAMVAERKAMMDDVVEKKDRELANLKAQLTIGVA
jgi:hypothetical protein